MRVPIVFPELCLLQTILLKIKNRVVVNVKYIKIKYIPCVITVTVGNFVFL